MSNLYRCAPALKLDKVRKWKNGGNMRGTPDPYFACWIGNAHFENRKQVLIEFELW